MPSSDTLRFGHALRVEPDRGEVDIDEQFWNRVLEILTGKASLEARRPREFAASAVSRVEGVLGHDASRPIIYAYIGDLHPDLGKVGLVVERTWCKNIAGVSRCDTGGLALARDATPFAVLSDRTVPQRDSDLRSVSSPTGIDFNSWENAFATEIENLYPSVKEYVVGTVPNFDRMAEDDVRRHCGKSCEGVTLDRRLWTWEARFDAPPVAQDIVYVALSPQTANEFLDFKRACKEDDLPETLRRLSFSDESIELTAAGWLQLDELHGELLGGADR